MVSGVSGIADSPIGLSHEAHQPLRFSEHLKRVNCAHERDTQFERAAGRRSDQAAGGEDCRRRCHAPAAPQAGTPKLADVSPVPLPYELPVRETPQITIQQLLPIGSIIDVTI